MSFLLDLLLHRLLGLRLQLFQLANLLLLVVLLFRLVLVRHQLGSLEGLLVLVQYLLLGYLLLKLKLRRLLLVLQLQ